MHYDNTVKHAILLLIDIQICMGLFRFCSMHICAYIAHRLGVQSCSYKYLLLDPIQLLYDARVFVSCSNRLQIFTGCQATGFPSAFQAYSIGAVKDLYMHTPVLLLQSQNENGNEREGGGLAALQGSHQKSYERADSKELQMKYMCVDVSCGHAVRAALNSALI